MPNVVNKGLGSNTLYIIPRIFTDPDPSCVEVANIRQEIKRTAPLTRYARRSNPRWSNDLWRLLDPSPDAACMEYLPTYGQCLG